MDVKVGKERAAADMEVVTKEVGEEVPLTR